MEDWESKYNELVKFVATQQFIIKNSVDETMKALNPEITMHRRYTSGQLHETVSLLLDFLVDQQKINIELNNSLQHEKQRAKVWEEACAELTKESEE